EVPKVVAASSVRNFKSKSGTRVIELPVPLCFRSSSQRLPRRFTNFGSGALGGQHCGSAPTALNPLHTKISTQYPPGRAGAKEGFVAKEVLVSEERSEERRV